MITRAELLKQARDKYVLELKDMPSKLKANDIAMMIKQKWNGAATTIDDTFPLYVGCALNDKQTYDKDVLLFVESIKDSLDNTETSIYDTPPSEAALGGFNICVKGTHRISVFFYPHEHGACRIVTTEKITQEPVVTKSITIVCGD